MMEGKIYGKNIIQDVFCFLEEKRIRSRKRLHELR